MVNEQGKNVQLKVTVSPFILTNHFYHSLYQFPTCIMGYLPHGIVERIK